MSNISTQFEGSPEEYELRRRKAIFKRIRILSVVCALSIGARILFKDPPPPKAPDRSKRTVRYVPGMMEDLSPEVKKRMDPKFLAEIKIAETQYKREKESQRRLASTSGTYQPANVPLTNPGDEEEVRQMEYIYEKRKINQLKAMKAAQPVDLTKDMLIRFRSGGFIKAENSTPVHKGFQIRVDKTILATVPRQLVSTVLSNAAKWKEPVPHGLIQLKPANGITITVSKETAKRITIRKIVEDET
ncbi:MAG: hypothetical protein KCHDKBKB_00332 [Elusimicrobia bacterium]|nr:hypothetical protein [Elusimicrobiota bacterium]